MPAQLSLYIPQQPVKVFLLEEQGTYTLGRDPDCQICIAEGSVSRCHARLASEGRRWTLEDLGSKNGTTVNGEATASASIDGDRWLAFGHLKARFQILGRGHIEQQAGRDSARWQTCAQIGEQLNGERDLRRLLSRLLAAIVQLAGTDRAFILLRDAAGELAVRAVLGVAPGAILDAEFAGSRSAAAEVLESGRSLVTSDSQCHRFLGQQPSVQLNAIRALACLPLEYGGERRGVVYTDSLALGKAITELDLRILEAMVDNAAMAIAAAVLRAELDDLDRRAGGTVLPKLAIW